MSGLIAMLAETALTKALVFGGLGALMMTTVVSVATLTAENLGSTSIDLGNATFTTDADTSVSATGIIVNLASPSADTSEEATVATFAVMNDALTAGDYGYKFDVFESGDDTWALNQTSTIDVYETTGGTTLSLGTYNTLQAAIVTGVEGVTITVNLGSVVPDEFDIVITKD